MVPNEDPPNLTSSSCCCKAVSRRASRRGRRGSTRGVPTHGCYDRTLLEKAKSKRRAAAGYCRKQSVLTLGLTRRQLEEIVVRSLHAAPRTHLVYAPADHLNSAYKSKSLGPVRLHATKCCTWNHACEKKLLREVCAFDLRSSASIAQPAEMQTRS